MRVLIVGGGIAGLAAAIGLARVGAQVTVMEQAGQFGEVGAGLSVWPNALRALDELGVGEQVRARARVARRPVIRDVSGRALSTTDLAETERLFGPLLIIHRAELLDVLVGALPAPVTLRRGVVVKAVQSDGSVAHSAGTTGADLVVGADGINSTVRTGLWRQARRPRYLGYSTYRMLTDPTDIDEDGEMWGRGLRFGWAPLPDGRVYCFAVVNTPAGQVPQALSQVAERFSGWHAPVPQLLRAVPPEVVLHHDLYELPPLSTYVSGRVGLIGDAAHGMAPNLGQGAGQGIEDAVTLAAVLNAAPSIPAALAAYDRQRRTRTQSVARRSRLIGVIAQLQSAPVVAVRDAVMRCTPDRAVFRSLKPVLSWQPPSGTGRWRNGGV
ncbi:FAD-dependent monooxygenase [Segeticoccus rhizosphaerae]|jgi:2-polyprenyl-6-methoxyphenol hydroxylase-like FAD-dependent oxidoreductase|uniref:FAD-dependent monooxygenase n=1 Tax=Segeticoccus rhizosphaerae TaxID=1104777 RepID=UPI001263FAB2|nr:FAD-dependent monooxygenase [Segeticoccus rhizosphaerae]